jgi:predicted lipoprotein
MRLTFLFILLISTVFTSCKKKEAEPTAEFDRASMLTNYSDQLIVPGYADLTTKMSVLNQKAIDFTSSLSLGSLSDLKTQWKETYIAWQKIKVYDFGPALSINLKKTLSFYPVDTTKINSNVSNNITNLGDATNLNTIGLNAIDYLLYHADDNTILQEFASTNRQNYLKNITAKMLTDVQSVKDEWNSYSVTFKAASGNDANSSLSFMVNEFNKDYELVKNAKIGVPLGEQSLGIKRPEYIEARYSGIGFDLIIANLDGLTTFFQGDSGSGFDDYLNFLGKKVGEQLLSDNIIGQLTSSSAKAASFSSSLENEIMNNDAEVKAFYAQLQGLVAEIKTDMPSAFGVFITYNDTDGD